jgi:deoxyribonuclease (pyrimidine dimer)
MYGVAIQLKIELNIMTRINSGIHPRELPTKLLVAERRELIRIPNCVKSGRAKISNATDTFKLGKGHVSFFYKRIGYLKKRYDELTKECIKRGIKASDFSNSFVDIPSELMQDWTPTKSDRILLIERIKERGFDLL